MTIDAVEATGHIALHYHLTGNNNNPNHAEYRSDNPWQTMNALRRELEDRNSDTARRLGVVLISNPDDSVWRLNLTGDVSSDSLETAAMHLLATIDARINIKPKDDVRAIVGERMGVMFEWQLTA
jgi:hypothetical protein